MNRGSREVNGGGVQVNSGSTTPGQRRCGARPVLTERISAPGRIAAPSPSASGRGSGADRTRPRPRTRGARRRRAGRGRGGDEVAAAVTAVAPRPGPAVSQVPPKQQRCRGARTRCPAQPGGAGPEEKRGNAPELPLEYERLGEGAWQAAGRGGATHEEAGPPKRGRVGGQFFCDVKL